MGRGGRWEAAGNVVRCRGNVEEDSGVGRRGSGRRTGEWEEKGGTGNGSGWVGGRAGGKETSVCVRGGGEARWRHVIHG